MRGSGSYCQHQCCHCPQPQSLFWRYEVTRDCTEKLHVWLSRPCRCPGSTFSVASSLPKEKDSKGNADREMGRLRAAPMANQGGSKAPEARAVPGPKITTL